MSTDPQLPRRHALLAIVAALTLLGSAPAGSSAPSAGESGCRDIVTVDPTTLARDVSDHDDKAVLPGVDLDDSDDTVTVTHTFSATVVLAKDVCDDVDYLIDLHDPTQPDAPRIATITGTGAGTEVAFKWSRTRTGVKVADSYWCVEFVARTVNDEGKVFDYSPDPSKGRASICDDDSSGGTASHG